MVNPNTTVLLMKSVKPFAFGYRMAGYYYYKMIMCGLTHQEHDLIVLF